MVPLIPRTSRMPTSCLYIRGHNHRVQEESKRHNRGMVFAFFKGFNSQRQPETAQRVDLMFRDVNKDRNESDSTSSCGGEERKHDREAQGLHCFRIFEGRNGYK